jgi:hypothetical protein
VAEQEQDGHLRLDTIAGGAAVELWSEELRKVIENICDPNVPHTGKRAITITATFEVDEKRERLDIGLLAASKLVTPRGASTVAYVAARGGQLSAIEWNPKQTRIEFAHSTAGIAAEKAGRP